MRNTCKYNSKAHCVAVFGLALFAMFGLTACSKNSVASNYPATPKQQENAAAMQREGVMSQQDALRLSQLYNSIDATDTISDQDLDWAIALMRQQSKSPGLLHARVMGLFLELMEIPPKKIPSSQRGKILGAIAPYSNNGDKLDEKYSAAVKRGIDRMN